MNRGLQLAALAGCAPAAIGQQSTDFVFVNTPVRPAGHTFTVFQDDHGPLSAISWDLTATTAGASWGSEIVIRALHLPSGVEIELDGSDANFADLGPSDVIFGWGNFGGAFASVGGGPISGIDDTYGMWRITVLDEFDDAPDPDAVLNGTITIHKQNPQQEIVLFNSVDGAAPVVFDVFQNDHGPLRGFAWDLIGSATGISWGSELVIRLQHLPTGYTFEFDGSDTNFADLGPSDVTFGWGNLAGDFAAAGSTDVFGGPMDTFGTWRVTLLDEFDDAGTDGALVGTITINKYPPSDTIYFDALGINGAAPLSFIFYQSAGGALEGFTWDLDLNCFSPSWGSELTIRLRHLASGYTFEFDGSDANFADLGPANFEFGWGNSSGAFSSSGSVFVPNGPLETQGEWEVTILEELDDSPEPDSILTGSITLNKGVPCSIADLAPVFGVLDFSDVFAFLVAFGNEHPAADLDVPFGVWDFSDVFAFLLAFGAGCP